jgi:type III secretory pathway component EscS
VLWTHLSTVVHAPLLTVQIAAVVVVAVSLVPLIVRVAKVVVATVPLVILMLVIVLVIVVYVGVVSSAIHNFQPERTPEESLYQVMSPTGTTPSGLEVP